MITQRKRTDGSVVSPAFPAQVGFSAAIVLVYLPCVIFLFAVMGDAEQIHFKSRSFFSHEAWQQVQIGRPISALFGNVPLYFIDNLGEFRWARAFSILTVVLCGCIMIGVLVKRLRVKPLLAATIAFGIFCLPGFIFSVMNPTAWPLHLLSIVLAFVAYVLFARSHASSLLLWEALRRAQFREARLIFGGRDHLATVLLAVVVLQLSLFDYPPNALLILVFPIATLLFSDMPPVCARSILLRDVIFLLAALTVYVLLSKFVYFPVSHYLGLLEPLPDEGIRSIYRFVFHFNPGDVARRLLACIEVSINLWMLPNARIAVWIGYGAIGVGLLIALSRRRNSPAGTTAALLMTVGAIAVCYVLSVAPSIFSLGGVVSYRTLAAPMSITLLVLLALLGRLHEALPAGLPALGAVARSEWPRAVPIFVLAAWATTYNVCSIISLGQNELSYVVGMVHDAVEAKADALIVLDRREVIYPDALTVTQDLRGHALTAYEPGCLSTYCMAAVGIYTIAKQELGLAPTALDVIAFRGPQLSNVSCEMLVSQSPQLPRLLAWGGIGGDFGQWLDTIAGKYEKISCRTYDLRWRNLESRGNTARITSTLWINDSIWRIFLPAAVDHRP